MLAHAIEIAREKSLRIAFGMSSVAGIFGGLKTSFISYRDKLTIKSLVPRRLLRLLRLGVLLLNLALVCPLLSPLIQRAGKSGASLTVGRICWMMTPIRLELQLTLPPSVGEHRNWPA